MYHFTLTQKIEELPDKDASDKMYQISQQWEDEGTPFGKLYLGVYDWAHDKQTLDLHIPKLRTGGEIAKNERASLFFGFDIYGDCFLEANLRGVQEINKL